MTVGGDRVCNPCKSAVPPREAEPFMQLHTVLSMPFAENTYIVWHAGSADAVIIDPGFEPEPVLERLADDGLTARMILNTHGHVDHIAGNAAVKAAFPDAPLLIGAGDAE